MVSTPCNILATARLFEGFVPANELEPIPNHYHNDGGQYYFSDTQTKHKPCLPGIHRFVNIGKGRQ